MNREEYMSELNKRMQGASESEIADAIAYCEEYFNEAMDDDKAIEDLGSPAKFAAQCKAESVIRQTGEDFSQHKPQSMLKAIVMITAGIFALPIALPLVLVAFLLILMFFIVFFILMIAGVMMVAACGYAVLISIISGCFHAQGVGDIFCSLGAALIFLGIGILAVLGTRLLIKRLLPYAVQQLSQFYHRHKEGGKQYEIN